VVAATRPACVRAFGGSAWHTPCRPRPSTCSHRRYTLRVLWLCQEEEDEEEDDDDDLFSALAAMFGGEAPKKKEKKDKERLAAPAQPAAPAAAAAGGTGEEDGKIHVFSLATGHLYERLLRIMMLSVTKRTSMPVKFWLFENYLSPSFKTIAEAMAQVRL